MGRSFGSAALLLTLAACNSPDPPRAEDHHAIIAAVLEAQPDLAASHREFLRDHPEERSFLSGLFDHRLCVEARTAGRPDDFSPSTTIPYGSVAPKGEPEWARPRESYAIARGAVPHHIRRASLFSICPSGTLRLSNPRFEGEKARVFWEQICRGWCGAGGEIVLTKVRGRWRVEERTGFWES
jgi:hypothetical protein